MQSSSIQWGKLTSLNPDFDNIPLSESPSNLAFFPSSDSNTSSNIYECQIYQQEQEYFLRFTGSCLTIQVNSKAIKEGKALRIYSGDRIRITTEDQIGVEKEYIFSSKLKETEMAALKRDREENGEIFLVEKKIKFLEDFRKESACLICEKMIYGCVSVVPCLHSFCMNCFMEHLKNAQDCPECEERFVEFRKNVFLNNLIESYEESGYKRDRSLEELQILEKKIVARFEYANEDVYEGEWKNCRKDGNGKMVYGSEDPYDETGKIASEDRGVYEGDWKNNRRHGQGKMILFDGAIYEGEWKNDEMEGKGRMIYPRRDFY